MIDKECEIMDRIKNLNKYQKGVLIFMIVTTLIFAVIYIKTISKVGYRYKDYDISTNSF